VVPELGGTTTVVALCGGGELLTQPENMALRINKLDATFIWVSSFIRMNLESTMVDPCRSCAIGAYHA
jgi:hypothetical protein